MTHQNLSSEVWADPLPTRTEWWVAKIERNIARDRQVTEALCAEGWTVVRLWESDVLADPAWAADRVEKARCGQDGEPSCVDVADFDLVLVPPCTQQAGLDPSPA